MPEWIIEWAVLIGTLAAGIGVIIIGWGLTALIIESWNLNTGKPHDGTAILAALTFALIGAAILSTL